MIHIIRVSNTNHIFAVRWCQWQFEYPGYITMTIVTGNETFPEQNITKEDLVVEDELPLVRLHLFSTTRRSKSCVSLWLSPVLLEVTLPNALWSEISWWPWWPWWPWPPWWPIIMMTAMTMLTARNTRKRKAYHHQHHHIQLCVKKQTVFVGVGFPFLLLYFLITPLPPNSNFKL